MNLTIPCAIDLTCIHDTVFAALVKEAIYTHVSGIGYTDAAFSPVEAQEITLVSVNSNRIGIYDLAIVVSLEIAFHTSGCEEMR